MSAISMIPALSACTSSPAPGTSVTMEMSAVRTISTSSCPTPTVSMTTTSLPAASSTSAASGLEAAAALAGGAEHRRRVGGGGGEPAEMAAGGHAADEHAGIGRMRLHPQPVAQHGAAAEGAGGIDGENANRRPGGAEFSG